MRKTSMIMIAAAMLMLPGLAMAQGIVGGAAEGAHEGNKAAGPVGAIVGGTVGAVGGGIAGLLGINQRPRFREYTIREHHESFTYDQPLALGLVLPEHGVTYYEVPEEYGVKEYRYAMVNGHAVLVDPRTRRIVEVID